MGKYIVKRLLIGIFSVIVVFTINFMVIHLAPGDPINYLMGADNTNLELRQVLVEKYGLDEPLYVQYFSYLKTVAQGDLGDSIIYNSPVLELIGNKVFATLLLCLLGAIISVIIGTYMGIVAARREGGIIDKIGSGVTYVLNAVPSFWLGIILIIVFATGLKLVPSYGMTSSRTNYQGMAYVKDVALHMILPLATLVLINIPSYFRIARSSVLQVSNEDFIQSFRATGMREKAIFNKYVFRNAILPTVTLFGISLAYLITGVSLIETVFSWPGMGRLVLTAINQRDYTMLMGIYLMMSISIAIMMLIVDVVYALLDPRIKYR